MEALKAAEAHKSLNLPIRSMRTRAISTNGVVFLSFNNSSKALHPLL
jgi:hypothetical protein